MKTWIIFGVLVATLASTSVARAGGVIIGGGMPPQEAAEARRVLLEGELRQRNVDLDETQKLIKGVEANVTKQFDYIRKLAESVTALRDAYRELSARDLQYDPNIRPPGSPSVPVSCRTDECDSCYTTAQEALNKAVFSLEKMRILYKRTKSFTEKALSFGDTSSGIHAVTGMAWQTQRRGIEASLKKFEAAYDAKKPELMTRLRTALDGLSQCEAEHYANPDWFNRFGFIYFQFMDQKYSR